MMAIGRYLLLIISLAALTITIDGRFSNEDVATFVDYIFRLHNAVRLKHNVLPLTRTENLNKKALLKLNKLKNVDENDEPLGEVSNYMYYDNNTQLNVEEAKRFFSLWYDNGDFYKYEIEPQNKHADSFTQIVWMSTTDIGITFRGDESGYEVLAVYSPPGNIPQHYRSNVLRPINNLPAIDHEIGLIYQTGKERFLDCLLELHNEARTKHRVPPLEYDDNLEDIANSTLMNRWTLPTETYGMNRFRIRFKGNMRLGDAVAKKVFLAWYKEEKLYKKYNYYNDQSATKHNGRTVQFSQIVWQNTRTIGIGVQQDGNEYEILAVYKPPGNLMGQYVSNVFMPRSMDQGESSGNNR